MVLAILNAIAAIPALLGYVEKFAAQCALWWIQRQKAESLAAVSDAAALAARATTDEERYKATDAWHHALGLPRVTSG